ncbi:YobI family P-loop NTPase [Mycoplasma yeatsii]|uniref:ABC-type bacteriocin/lantibiotic exporter with double-glycine peptidase domain n=1 Tax=Mycoplasma yeatsii TaxID=51365 RepID=A0ABU0NEK5_9MOLU|nr:hypothetical protein [Mycoplasma yeatsii]MDQ0567875.1 ABC-type bacteriocin/lantibiotic exporter with double-glycine peptidase domain [Mycoplasma yeatsii]
MADNLENVIKLYSLAPEALDNEETPYEKHLNEVLDPTKESIKNIAISGPYGSGKSTIWNTYVKNKEIKNIINVSLAKYYIIDQKEEKKDVENSIKLLENRLERQIINQIISQIDPKLIPLYKNKIKEHKSKKELIPSCIISAFLILGILGFASLNIFSSIIDNKKFLIPILITAFTFFILVPICFWIWKSLKNIRLL